jgi:HAD superfamily hydrolase (TIGR01509 family)
VALIAFPRLEAEFFDLDGTLADTETLLNAVTGELVTAAGHDYSAFDYASIVGTTGEQAGEAIVKAFGLKESGASFDARRRKRLRERIPSEVRACPGALQALEKSKATGAFRGVVSASDAEYVHMVLDALAFRSCFTRCIVTSDTPGVERQKPFADPYLMAAKIGGVNPFRCIVREDSVQGATAGAAAGMFVVAIPHRFSPRERLAVVAQYVIPEGQTIGDFEYAEIDHMFPQAPAR